MLRKRRPRPNHKVSPEMLKIQEEIHGAIKGPPKIKWDALYERVVDILEEDAPGKCTMVQNLSYWRQDYRNPTWERLGAYYLATTKKRLPKEVAQKAVEPLPRKRRIRVIY